MIYVVCQPLSTFCTILLFLIAQTKPIKLRVERTEGKYFKLKCWALSNLLFCFQTDRGSTIFLVSFVSRSGQVNWVSIAATDASTIWIPGYVGDTGMIHSCNENASSSYSSLGKSLGFRGKGDVDPQKRS